MKIVVFETEKWECDILQKICCDHEVVFTEEPLRRGNVHKFKDADIISPFVHSELNSSVLECFETLSFIATRSTGYDHIDLESCSRKGIPVSNVPVYGDHTVAEHVFALLLSISHRIPEAVNRTRKGDFSQKGLQGFDLQNKTLGVVGTGSIGKRVARIARGFGLNVIAYDPKPDAVFAARYNVSYMDMDGLLQQSDIVTLHVPGSKATNHLLSDREISRMKDGVVLINTARGSIVDTQALLRALADGKVAAAGLDVLPDEPSIREEAELIRSFFDKKHDLETLFSNHVLLHMRNVIITPHSAFNTKEAVERILYTTGENTIGFMNRNLKNVVS